jgi:prepilin-type N-terminal cleavage/methylation domain-containing protein
MNTKNKAFTIVELIVSVSIIAIITSIWFYSYVWYLWDARDSKRKADIANLTSALKEYKQQKWAYPIPWNYFNITNSWTVVAYQWKINKNVILTTIDEFPTDPYKWEEYWYSVTKNRQEEQVTVSLENGDFPLALLQWSYHSVSFNVLPTLILALNPIEWTNIEVHTWVLDWSTNRQKFILNQWKNLLYSFVDSYAPVYWYSGLDLWNDVILAWEVNYWNNSDYRTCLEINEAWKSIWDWEYQILNNSWALTNTWCTF